MNSNSIINCAAEYIAPEVIAAGKKVAPGSGAAPNVYGPACDLWSCGVVLFMLLGGQPPFWDDSQPTMLRKIMKGSFSFADHVWKSVSWQAKDLISRLLVVDPAKRLTCTQVRAVTFLRWAG
jgi:serine/threonine protein kinase